MPESLHARLVFHLNLCLLQFFRLRLPRSSRSMVDLRNQLMKQIEANKPAPFLIVQSTQHNFVNLTLGTQSAKQFHLFESTVRCCLLQFHLFESIVHCCLLLFSLYMQRPFLRAKPLSFTAAASQTLLCVCSAFPLGEPSNRLSTLRKNRRRR